MLEEVVAAPAALLPVGSARVLEFPEYETQDAQCDEDVSELSDDDDADDSSDSCTVKVSASFEELSVGECVQVYWKGERKWYEGEIKDIDNNDRTFEVYYPSDGKQLWHDEADYPLRFAC